MKSYKGLEANNQFVNGWVRDIGSNYIKNRTLVIAKVNF